MPWKKLLAWATGQIDEALRQKLEFVLEENRVYRALLDRHSPRWLLHDAKRKVLAEKGKLLGAYSDADRTGFRREAGRCSDAIRTPFRLNPDSVPAETGQF